MPPPPHQRHWPRLAATRRLGRGAVGGAAERHASHSSSTSPPLRRDGRSRSRPVRARPTPPLAPPPIPLRGAPSTARRLERLLPNRDFRAQCTRPTRHASAGEFAAEQYRVLAPSRRHRAENPVHSAPTEAAGGRWPIATIVTKCCVTQVAFVFAWPGIMMKFCKNPGRPLRCPYLPTYLPTLLMGN